MLVIDVKVYALSEMVMISCVAGDYPLAEILPHSILYFWLSLVTTEIF